MRKVLFLSIGVIFFNVTWANSIQKDLERKSDQKIIKEYLQLHSQFFKKFCSRGQDHSFDMLYKAFRGDGHFVPVLAEKFLDKQSIWDNLTYLEQKKKWIRKQEKLLVKYRSFKNQLSLLDQVEKRLFSALKVMHAFYQKKSKKNRVRKKKAFLSLKQAFNRLTKSLFFLKSFRFPIDHFSLRSNYDQYAMSPLARDKQRANSLYLRRKILQDGAQDANHSRSDRNLRALLDTLYLRINRPLEELEEDIRYDLFDFIRRVRSSLKKGPKAQRVRFKEWRERTERAFDFYSQLVQEQNQDLGRKLLKKKSKTRFDLKDFTLRKQRDVYKFWIKRSELYQALFTLETILFNEVGDIDGPGRPEAHDVAQVVVNRLQYDDFAVLKHSDDLYPFKDDLYPYLRRDLDAKLIERKSWPNVLFKTGEFSFTYFFIPGSVKIYCPDVSPRGRRLRFQNLKVSLDVLRSNKKQNPEALRYFSRASMHGRIDMTQIWNGFSSLPQEPGLPVPRSKKRVLMNHIKKKNFRFFNQFEGRESSLYWVVEIKKKPYVLERSPKKGRLFFYRNPHFFRYFSRDQQ